MHDMMDVLRRTAAAGKIYQGGISRLEGEDYPAYFKRVTSAATADGKCRLLLSMSAPYEERDVIQKAWREVI
jgi:hypothetical protein